MKATFNQHIGIFEDAVPKEFCNEIINLFDSNPNSHISRQNSENNINPLAKSDHHLGGEVNRSKFFNYFNKFFWDHIYPQYQSKYMVDIDINPFPKFISDFKIQKTLPTEGYHMWHYEIDSNPSTRIMVYTLYLNNVEEGGETEFLYQSLRLKPKQGTIVLWPAGYTHIHRGNPPLSGEKYIVTGWINWSTPN